MISVLGIHLASNDIFHTRASIVIVDFLRLSMRVAAQGSHSGKRTHLGPLGQYE